MVRRQKRLTEGPTFLVSGNAKAGEVEELVEHLVAALPVADPQAVDLLPVPGHVPRPVVLNPVHHLADEGFRQHGPRHILRHPPLAGVEDGRLIQRADGVAMRALDVVGEDQQLGLGVDLGPVGKDQGMVAHTGLGPVRARLDHDAALEHAPSLIAHDALGQLGGGPVVAAVDDHGGQVGVALVTQEIDAV